MNSDPFIERNGTLDSVATAFANKVLPHPGGPSRSCLMLLLRESRDRSKATTIREAKSLPAVSELRSYTTGTPFSALIPNLFSAARSFSSNLFMSTIFMWKVLNFNNSRFCRAWRINNSEPHDIVFTWIPGEQVIESKWDLKHVGNHQFTLRSVHNDEYLYTSKYKQMFSAWPSASGHAPGNQFVFTWRDKGVVVKEAMWTLKKIDGNFYSIKNQFYDTFLSVETKKYDKDRRHVYSIDVTVQEENVGSNAQWQLMKCT
ncbi:hypothetical protein B566_EDAN007403 [Ephemera danica]|nr:hypothetical protein B566_EDAN007403 [Ephemera danica]